MTWPQLSLHPGLLLWPALLSLCIYLLVARQPIGRPKQDPREWLDRYDIDRRVAARERRERARLFESDLLEGLLRPVLDDAAALLHRLLRRLGVGDPAGLERVLAQVAPRFGVLDWYGIRIGAGLIFLAVGPTVALLGIRVLPLWTWPLWFVAGAAVPDAWLHQRWQERRSRLLRELDAGLDLVGIAVASGLAGEQAMGEVARATSGLLARELRVVCGSLAVGGHSLVGAFEGLAERFDLPELWRLAGALGAASEQGLPLGDALAAQADALRDARRARLVAEGGRAAERMIVPIVPVILVVLLIVIGAPAARLLLGLGS